MQRPDEATLRKFCEFADVRLEQERALGAGPTDAALAAGDVHFTGSVTFGTAFVFQEMTAQLDFGPGDRFVFSGRLWGLGFGAGVTWGGGRFWVPLSGLAECDVSVTQVFGGMLEARWIRNGGAIGFFFGGGLGVGAALMGGSGKFTRRS